jgi:hypothetical protein
LGLRCCLRRVIPSDEMPLFGLNSIEPLPPPSHQRAPTLNYDSQGQIGEGTGMESGSERLQSYRKEAERYAELATLANAISQISCTKGSSDFLAWPRIWSASRVRELVGISCMEKAALSLRAESSSWQLVDLGGVLRHKELPALGGAGSNDTLWEFAGRFRRLDMPTVR